MTDDLKDLEAELESLAPAEPSPRLARSVARGFAGADRPAWRSPRVPAVVAGAAVAACFVAGVLTWPAGRPDVRTADIGRRPPASFPAVTIARGEVARPALGVYADALSRSPDDLDRLLDRQAAAFRRPHRAAPAWGTATDITH